MNSIGFFQSSRFPPCRRGSSHEAVFGQPFAPPPYPTSGVAAQERPHPASYAAVRSAAVVWATSMAWFGWIVSSSVIVVPQPLDLLTEVLDLTFEVLDLAFEHFDLTVEIADLHSVVLP